MHPPPPNLSINYSSATPSPSSNIVLPGSSLNANKANAEEGVVITPEPSGIVIKTRLLKTNADAFSLGESTNEPYVPQSVSTIAGASPDEQQAVGFGDSKVFINICTHPLIALPVQRKGLDDETGKEVDGWRLPMSMGELRPCYDKNGQSAIVADCILNPKILQDMQADSSHMHFVVDLTIQAATRKFINTWFGGKELDRRYKLPKMKYAGYVDETTGLPILSRAKDGDISEIASAFDITQRPSIAKQRVRGDGGKPLLIEEVDEVDRPKKVKEIMPSAAKVDTSTTVLPQFRIELFVEVGEKAPVPMIDFLKVAADSQQSETLRRLIVSPNLKKQVVSNGDTGKLHESQFFTIPVPIDVDGTLSIVARCSTLSPSPPPLPTVNVSASQLTLSSTSNSTTECVLPFPVDTHSTSSKYNQAVGTLEVRMPLLKSARKADEGADPGTHQWKLQNAFGDGGSKSTDTSPTEDKDETKDEALQAYFLESEPTDEDIDDDDPLPEDTFHSQDVLSRHLLQQQEEERNTRKEKSSKESGREDADVEYIDANDFRPGGKFYTTNESTNAEATNDRSNDNLRKAEDVLKLNLQQQFGSASLMGGLV
jgi:hypothetical protein